MEYIVVGSNNFWYHTGDDLEEAKRIAIEIVEGNDYSVDPETGYSPDDPEEVYIYRCLGSCVSCGNVAEMERMKNPYMFRGCYYCGFEMPHSRIYAGGERGKNSISIDEYKMKHE